MARELRVNLRLIGDEADRFELVMTRVRERHVGKISATDLVKELLFLQPHRILNTEDLAILRGESLHEAKKSKVPRAG